MKFLSIQRFCGEGIDITEVQITAVEMKTLTVQCTTVFNNGDTLQRLLFDIYEV